jgi:hypothetical protein
MRGTHSQHLVTANVLQTGHVTGNIDAAIKGSFDHCTLQVTVLSSRPEAKAAAAVESILPHWLF